MICLYDRNEEDFTHNGIAVLDDIYITGKVIENLKGVFVFDGSFLMSEKALEIKNGMILKMPTPKGYQLFRIQTNEPQIFSIKIYAKCLAYDLEGNYLENCYVDRKNGQEAISHMLNSLKFTHKFTGHSDITTINSARYIKRNFISKALIEGEKNSFFAKWGGDIDFNNFDITINEKIGNVTGIVLEYGKDIVGFNIKVDDSEVVTVIEPNGFDGMGIDEKTVISPKFDLYPIPYYKNLKWDEVRVYNDEEPDKPGFPSENEAKQELKRLCEELYTKGIDTPKISVEIDYIELSKTQEASYYKEVTQMKLGDYLTVKINNIMHSQDIRFIEYEYDPLQQCYLKLYIGDVKPNIFAQVTKLEGQLNEVCGDLGGNDYLDILSKAKDKATQLIEQGCQNSYVIARLNEILIGDNPLVSQMRNMIIMNKNGIGFSNNGYRPEGLVMALLIDGSINASVVTTGTLDATKCNVVNLNASNITSGTISANKISGGTINANNVSIINLNADNITSGTISASRISGGTISANIVRGGVLQSNGSYSGFNLDTNNLWCGDFVVWNNHVTAPSLYIHNNLEVRYHTYMYGNLTVDETITAKNLNVTGDKTRIVKTKNYGIRGLNAYETADCYFGDIGESKTDEFGLCRIYFDKIFLETVNTKEPYQVFLTNYSEDRTSYIRCVIREEKYFIIKGSSNTKFGYEVKVKQRDYENIRLKKIEGKEGE